jgi:hypothetical protein
MFRTPLGVYTINLIGYVALSAKAVKLVKGLEK